MSTNAYRFDRFTVDVLRACVYRDDAAVPLRPKSFALLEYLVAHADRLVTKDELMSALWPKMIVTDDSLTRCVSEVRAAIGDTAQQMIKTVARRGYVFAEAVTEIIGADARRREQTPEVEPAESNTATSPVATGQAPRLSGVGVVRPPSLMSSPASPHIGSSSRRRVPVAVILALLAVGLLSGLVVLQWLAHARTSSMPPRMTMVVLPFANLGGDPGQTYLGDALTEDLTAALSRLHGATVIASGTAFTYKNRVVDPRSVGADLDVRYVVQGSVAQTVDGLRVHAGLVDARDAKSLWSDEYDVNRAELPRARDQIVARLANALDVVIVRADSERSSRVTPAEVDAEDLAMRCAAASHVNQGESNVPSYSLCKQALELDPRNVRALVQLAIYQGERVERNQSPEPAADLARARDWVDRALAADPLYAEAHCANAIVRAAEHKLPDALAAAERCRVLNPSSARALRTLAVMHFFLVEPERTIEFCDRGLVLSPRDPSLAAFMLFKGWAYAMMKRDEDALFWLRKADTAAPATPSIMLPLVSMLALTGHDTEARETLTRYLTSSRARTRTLAQWAHAPNDSAAFLAFADRFKEGLRKAGMPDS